MIRLPEARRLVEDGTDLEAIAVSRVMAKGQELNRGLTPEAVEKAKGNF